MKVNRKYKTYRWLQERRLQRNFIISLLLLIAVFCCAVKFASAQPSPAALPPTLSADQVIAIIRQYHPELKQADIDVERTKAGITAAKGGFDPVLQAGAARKTFDGTTYYNHVQPELKIPTWYGIEITAGAEYLSGSRTDPQETIGQTSFAGFSIPLAKNLLMDKRRAALQQSKIFYQLSQQERRARINDLLQEAMNAYWNWAQQYRLYALAAEAVTVSEKRLQLVRTAFVNGDRAALDTTEALTQLQSFQYLQNETWLAFQQAALDLSLYLWKENNEPYELPVTVLPTAWTGTINSSSLPVLDELLRTAAIQHPELRQYDFKLDALEVERKLKFQELLPSLNLKYNSLGKGYNVLKTATTPLLENNYQYGVSFSIPLRLSQGRGEYRQTRFKITETRLDLNIKQQQVQNKIRNYYYELQTLANQVSLLENSYRNFQNLLRGEEARLFNGESSLFLVNSRESKVLEAAQKLAAAKAKFYNTAYKLQWAAGLLAG